MNSAATPRLKLEARHWLVAEEAGDQVRALYRLAEIIGLGAAPFRAAADQKTLSF